jgi:hypothetical protein
MTNYFYSPTKPPECGIGSDGNFIVVGDPVRHSSDDLAIRHGSLPGAPGTIEKLTLRYQPGGEAEVWALARWPKTNLPWPSPPGGGAVEDRANFFRKVTREEIVAERMLA